MRLETATILAAMVLASTPAHASGSYGNSLLSPSFRFTYVENVRKSFVDGDQSRAYMEEHDRDLKVRFLGFQARAEKVIAAARKAGTPIAAYDVLVPAVRLPKPALISKLDKKAYPLNLVLDASTEHATVRFELTATRPWTLAQLTSLTASLKALSSKPSSSEYSDERTEREQKLIDAAAFVGPVAVTHVDANFGLYVGTTSEVAGAEKARVLAPLQALLDKLVPLLREKFSKADAAAQLHLVELAAIGPEVEKHPQKLPGAFHPWGPLVGGSLIRINEQLGGASVILMVSPVGKYEWKTVHPVMTAWLQEGLADPHRALIEGEAERLSGEER